MIWLWIVGIVVVVVLLLWAVMKMGMKPGEDSIWHDKRRPIFGLPLSFTVYELTEQRLYVRTGFLSVKEEEIRLYRILDLTYEASLFQRMFGVGCIKLVTSDKTAGTIVIDQVKKAREVKELMAEHVEMERDKKRVVNREVMMNTDDFDALDV